MIKATRVTVATIRKQELKDKVLGILEENKDGLTTVQIAVLAGTRSTRQLLMELRKERLVSQKKGLSNGRLAILYLLSKNTKIQ